jgi:predicted nuclease with TOPRIM domain
VATTAPSIEDLQEQLRGAKEELNSLLVEQSSLTEAESEAEEEANCSIGSGPIRGAFSTMRKKMKRIAERRDQLPAEIRVAQRRVAELEHALATLREPALQQARTKAFDEVAREHRRHREAIEKLGSAAQSAHDAWYANMRSRVDAERRLRDLAGDKPPKTEAGR